MDSSPLSLTNAITTLCKVIFSDRDEGLQVSFEVVIFLNQLGVNSSSGNGDKLTGLTRWSNEHNVYDDADPRHYDVISLVSRFVV